MRANEATDLKMGRFAMYERRNLRKRQVLLCDELVKSIWQMAESVSQKQIKGVL